MRRQLLLGVPATKSSSYKLCDSTAIRRALNTGSFEQMEGSSPAAQARKAGKVAFTFQVAQQDILLSVRMTLMLGMCAAENRASAWSRAAASEAADEEAEQEGEAAPLIGQEGGSTEQHPAQGGQTGEGREESRRGKCYQSA